MTTRKVWSLSRAQAAPKTKQQSNVCKELPPYLLFHLRTLLLSITCTSVKFNVTYAKGDLHQRCSQSLVTLSTLLLDYPVKLTLNPQVFLSEWRNTSWGDVISHSLTAE